MSKHTRGPWRVIAGDVQAQSIDEEWDLTICTGCDDADARLIAAAPDMLEALKKIIRENTSENGFPGFTEALVAIAKAE